MPGSQTALDTVWGLQFCWGRGETKELQISKGAVTQLRWNHWACLDLHWGTCWVQGAEWISPLCCQPTLQIRPGCARILCQGSVAGPHQGMQMLGREGIHPWARTITAGLAAQIWFYLLSSGLGPKATTPELHWCCPGHPCIFVFQGFCDEAGFRLKSSWLVMDSERLMFKLHCSEVLLETPC